MQWENPANAYVSVFCADPGCVSFTKGSKAWLQANLGSFSGFATLQDLQALNPNFSSVSADHGCSIFGPKWSVYQWSSSFCCFISYRFPFVGRNLVSAHSYSGGTIDTELRGLEWHRPDWPCVWATWGGQWSGKCGWIPDRTDSKWNGRLLPDTVEEWTVLGFKIA